MKARRYMLLALGGLLAAAACGGDGGSGPSQSELVGTWQVVRCAYVSTGGLGTVDLISGGGTGTLVLTADDTLRLDVTPASGPSVHLIATYEIRGIDLMRVTPAGASWYWAWDMALSSGALKLTGADAEYDFNQDGLGEPAKWDLTMTR
jgi:hypothetical protein